MSWLSKIFPKKPHVKDRALLIAILNGLAEQEKQQQERHGWIMAKLSTLADTLAALEARIDKATGEIVAEIAALKAALGDTEIPQAAQDALDRLATKAQALDDLNPDAPTP
jgi:hypothetical protein